MARQQCCVATRRLDVMAPTPKLVIFDCDGVLVDSEPLSMRVMLETLAAAGLQLDAETAYARFLGTSMKSICAKLAREDGIELDEAALERLRQRLYAVFRAELQPTPGVAETLGRLTVPFCVASSSQPERIELSLEITGLRHHFAGRIFSATMVEHGKPAPDLFLHAAKSMDVAPATALVVEDSPVGVAAAKAARMRVIGFTGGSHAKRPANRAALEAAEPDALIDDMANLLAIVDA